MQYDIFIYLFFQLAVNELSKRLTCSFSQEISHINNKKKYFENDMNICCFLSVAIFFYFTLDNVRWFFSSMVGVLD